MVGSKKELKSMRILFIRKEANTQMNQWQRVHIFDQLTKNGCEIATFSPFDFETHDSANENLINLMKTEQFDMIVCPYNEKIIYIDTIIFARTKGIATLLMCYDNLVVPYVHKKIAKYYDLVWLTSKETQPLFVEWGAHTIFLPYAANPDVFTPKYSKNENKCVFVGTPYGSRSGIINRLTNNAVEVDLFYDEIKGNPAKWSPNIKELFKTIIEDSTSSIGRKIMYSALKTKLKRQNTLNLSSEYLSKHDSVDILELSSIYCNYSLSLSSTVARNTGILKKPVPIVNLRSFEIPMSGGVQFCLYNEELGNYFEEDREIIFYRSDDEMIEKARYYLNNKNSNTIINIKACARKRAENEHTWLHRYKKVFESLNLKM
jgi:hypothetical protein